MLNLDLKPYKADYFIEGRYCGSSEFQGWYPLSVVFFCRCCGREWARIAVTGHGRQDWTTELEFCRKCTSPTEASLWWHTPGSVLIWHRAWDSAHMYAALQVRHFPFAVLRWCFERELEKFERFQHEQTLS